MTKEEYIQKYKELCAKFDTEIEKQQIMEVDYKEVLALGFKREEYEDKVYFDQYGYNSFQLNYTNGIISFVWFPEGRTITMYINEQIYKRGVDIDEVKYVIRLLETKM